MKWMKNALLALALGLAVSACTMLPSTEPVTEMAVPASLDEAGQEAQKLVNEANVLLTATANVVASNVRDGIWSAETGRAYIDKIIVYSVQVDDVQDMLDLGMTDGALNQAQLLSQFIMALNKEVARRANEE